jgi:hypothetical protein
MKSRTPTSPTLFQSDFSEKQKIRLHNADYLTIMLRARQDIDGKRAAPFP